jgi:hypothetical protein
LSAARTLPRSTRFALALLLVHILHSGVIVTWLVVGMDTRFLVGRLLMVVPFIGSVVVFMGLLRRAPWAWWVSVLVGGYTALIFVRLLTTRESRDAFRVMVT